MWRLAALALLLCVALAGASFGVGTAHAQQGDNDYVDLELILQIPDHYGVVDTPSGGFFQIDIIAFNHGSRPAYDVEVVVDVIYPTSGSHFDTPRSGLPPNISLHDDDRKLRWFIPKLDGMERQQLSYEVQFIGPTDNPFRHEDHVHEHYGEITTSSFESELHTGNNTARVWAAPHNSTNNDRVQAAGNYILQIEVDTQHPAPGDTVNFKVISERETPTPHILRATPPIDLIVNIEFTDGLTVSGTATYETAGGFADPPAQLSYSNGMFHVGTLTSDQHDKHAVILPVTVASEATVNEQCLTAKLTGNPPPGVGPYDDKITDNTATLCLGRPTLPYYPADDPTDDPTIADPINADATTYDPTDHLTEFVSHPCVGVSDAPCDSTDDIRVRAIDTFTDLPLEEGTPLILIPDDLTTRQYDDDTNSVNNENTVSWQTTVQISYEPFGTTHERWGAITHNLAYEMTSKESPFDKLHLRPSWNANYALLNNDNRSHDFMSFPPTAGNNGPWDLTLEFEKLGTYDVTYTVTATHDNNTDMDTADDVEYSGAGTYTFHIGPTADLQVLDGGVSHYADADQHTLTVVAVNNDSFRVPNAQVTGLPTAADVITISHGTYDSAAGTWDVGPLDQSQYYHSAGTSQPTLTLVAASGDTADVTIASTKNHEVCVRASTSEFHLPHNVHNATKADCDAITNASWNSTPIPDLDKTNNTVTVTAVQGTGGVGAATVENTTVSITVQWDPVEYVHGIPVAHYEIQWSADGSTSWTSLVNQVMGTLYVDTEPQSGDTRHYRVRPVSQAGHAGPWTLPMSATATAPTITPPGRPTALTATVSTADVSDIVLTWTAPTGTPAAASYDIQISEDGSTNWQPLINGVTATSYTHSDVGYNVTRHYRVRAKETQNQPGDWSNTDSATTGNPAPLAPANLSALPNGLDGIIVAWDAADRNGGAPITHYEVEWSADGSTNWTSLNDNVSGTSIVDTAPTDGTTRYYRARAVNATGLKSPDSNTDSATATTATLDPPGTPTGLTATVSNVSGILLTWTAPTGTVTAARYEIDYSANGNAPWTPLVNNVTSTSHIHSNVGYGVTRHYRVRAVNSEGLAGEWSSTDDATTDNPAPLAPTGVEALPNGLMGLVVFWNAASRNQGAPITHYEVQWSADGNEPWTTLVSSVVGTSYIDTAPAADVTRHYRVRAVNATSLMSPWSDSDSATAIREALAAPGAPTGLSATVSNVSDVLLSWTASTDGVPVARYEIEYSADGNAPWRPLANKVTGTGYTDNGADYGETRHYRVRAVNTEGLEGNWSGTTDATTQNPTPGVPTNVMAVAQGLTGIIVSWNPPTAYQGKPVTHYEVEVSPDGNDPWTSQDDSITSNVYTHTGLSANDTRHYRVYAYNGAGRSNASSVVIVTIPTALQGATAGPPGVPVVTAQPNGRTEIVLRWNKPVENGSPIISYDVEVSERQNGPWTDAEAGLTGTATSWTHTGLIGNTTRYYRVRAENHIDTGGWSDTVRATTQAPGQADAPLNLRAMPDGDTAIDLAWDPPADDGGSPIIRYEVQWSPNGTEGSWRNEGRTPNAETRTYKDTGLTFGTTRHYRVAARNSVTLGVWSAGVTTTTLSGVPGTPGLTVRATDANTIALTWTVPADNGDPITGYEIQWSPDGAEGTWNPLTSPAAADTSHDDGGLDPGTRRYYRIRAVNDTGNGSWSAVRNAVTPPAVPSAPTLSAAANGENAINLSWEPPTDDGGADISQYELHVSTDGGSNYSRLTSPSASARAYTHTGLQPGTTRHYQLRARNRAGWGEFSQPADATTLTGVARAPSLTARANGATEIKLTWTKPDDRGSDILRYELQESDDGNDWNPLDSNIPASDTEYVRDGLSGGTTRHYRIRAVNANGEGQWSTARSARTDAGGPDAPALTLTVIDDNRIDLSWTVPANNGSAIRGYWVERSADGNEPWERLTSSNRTTSYSDNTLYRGMTRHYRVAAYNGAGTGPYSETKSATTTGDPATAPPAPLLLRFSAVGRNEVTITWDPPSDDGGAPVSGYEYEVAAPCQDDPERNCGFNLGNEKATTNTSVRISSLNLEGDYYFRVRAVNPVGKGDWTAEIHALLRPSMSGLVRVSTTAITVDEGDTVTYTVRLSTNPPHPVGLFVQPRSIADADDLGDAALVYTSSVLIPTGWTHPRGDDWSEFAYNWNQGVKVTFTGPEDDDDLDDVAVMDHYVRAMPYGDYRPCSEEETEADRQQCQQDWEDDWAQSPYRHLTGAGVKVVVRDND